MELNRTFENLVFCTEEAGAEDWRLKNVAHDEVESRVLPGMAVPENSWSKKLVIGVAH